MAQLLVLGPVFAGPQGVAAALAAITKLAAALKVVEGEPAGSAELAGLAGAAGGRCGP